MKKKIHIVSFVVLSIFLFGLSACNNRPFIDSFEASPSSGCPAVVINLEWETSPSPSSSVFTILSKAPGGPIMGTGLDGSFNEDDTYSEPIDTTTVYTLTAQAETVGPTVSEARTVEIISGSDDQPLGVTGHCLSFPVWDTLMPSSDWDTDIEVGTVYNESGVDIEVKHAGSGDVIRAGGETDEFDGVSFVGEWKAEPIDVHPAWEEFCRDNPGFEGDIGDYPEPISPDPPLEDYEEPPDVWIRVELVCPWVIPP